MPNMMLTFLYSYNLKINHKKNVESYLIPKVPTKSTYSSANSE